MYEFDKETKPAKNKEGKMNNYQLPIINLKRINNIEQNNYGNASPSSS